MGKNIFLTIAKAFVFFSALFLVSFFTSTKVYGSEEVATIPKSTNYVYGLTSPDEQDFTAIYAYDINGYDQIAKYFKKITTKAGKIAVIKNANNLGVREDGFYFKENTGIKMYHVDWDGIIQETWDDPSLTGSARSGTFLTTGKYVTTSDQLSNKKNELYIYDINYHMLEKKVPLTNKTDIPLPVSKLNSMGDIVGDADDYLYATISEAKLSSTTVLKIDSNNGDIVDILPVPGLQHSPAIAFMEDGRLLLADKNDTGAIVDFSTGLVTYTDKIGDKLPAMGGTQSHVRDFASLNFPSFNVELFAIKQGPETAVYGEEYEYTIKVSNTGNIMSLHNTLIDSLSNYLEYVPNSTLLNGNKVVDVNGTSQMFLGGMKIESPGGVEGAITKDKPAVITFKVKVKDTGDTTVGIDIPNIAYIANTSTNLVSTNKVITKVPGIPISEYILNLYIKQEVLNSRLDLVSPSIGFADVKNNFDQYQLTIPSYLSDTNQAFKFVKIKVADMNDPYNVSIKIPEFYSYAGYQLTATKSNHLASNRMKTPIESIDPSKGLDRWLTVYIEPKLFADAPPFYSWDYKNNDFGKIGIE
ncbi:hypothetical protein UAW_02118 [Enterococcus haemoperoxidus ATCC BAA-382]|uniref:DUF11 domain-containing protein n=1 Tax=Enterococcus haemoperoxidus ATCC BAA-382 TaxID=1158608 RepID=R2T480_9ENTE|nr:isopeptide-forming domain-containing fimbrial protein [Enterococcus haemoperoxidus]EOH95039.1 hypothetical protein UAW_02118 [Enterococcus haemoperoxidus ATCC BAA-382]EOT60438.1 hypothetical protein I583_03084 [Enterococcus haemoperoxidus ATCC BAA-382]OJG54870.1 hypothetical protein RV06_GL002392 [Enterococcus haemoperoxidus]